MITAVITGKAVLRIEKFDSKWVPFNVHPSIQSVNIKYPKKGKNKEMATDCIIEAFSLMDTEGITLPNAAYKLKVGQWCHVAITYEFVYSVDDYYNEGDLDFYIHKQKVLHKSKPV